LALILSPLLLGFVNQTKAFFAGRVGVPFTQLYFDLFKLFKKDGKKGVLMDKRETSELEVSIPLTQIGTYVWAVVPENTDDLKDKPKLNYIKIDNARPPAPLIEKNIEFEILDKVIK